MTKLETYLESHSVAEAKGLLEACGLKAAAAAGQGGLLLSRDAERLAHWDLFRRRLDILAELDVRTLIVAADFVREPTSEDYGRAVASLAEAAEFARGVGIRLALEFQKGSRFCSSLDTALAIIAQAGAENVGVCLDLFHYYTGPSKFEDLGYLSPANLAWVQLMRPQRSSSRACRRLRPDLAGRGRLSARPDPRPPRDDWLCRIRFARSAQPVVLVDRRELGRGHRPAIDDAGPRSAGHRPFQGRAVSLTVAAIRQPIAIYREEQRFGWWLYGLVSVMFAISWITFLGRHQIAPDGFINAHGRSLAVAVAVGMVLPVILVVGVLRMTTIISPDEVRIWFGFYPTIRRSISIGTIASVEVVKYRPIVHCGGWGIRIARDGERVFNARGNRGVRLKLADGTTILIGSQRPEELALAVKGVLRPGT